MVKSIYISESHDPTINLAVEEYLIENCSDNEIIMYLWQNENTVVIGKHQNPLKECNINKLKEDNIKLVRRNSGGGAVFHDLGNLNFTFIAKKEIYDEKKHFSVILKALEDFSVSGKHTGRNDITVDDKKFSGNAFSHKENVSCHHGTLLIDADMKKLSQYLTPSKLKLESKGVDSVKSRVVNLKQLNETMTVKSMKESLIKAFDVIFAGEIVCREIPDYQNIQRHTEKYKTWDWNIAESPKATISTEKKFDWGMFAIDITVKNGKISNCVISSDTLLDEHFKSLCETLIDTHFKYEEIQSAIIKHLRFENIKQDLLHCFSSFVI